jgi:hypothetical protein
MQTQKSPGKEKMKGEKDARIFTQHVGLSKCYSCIRKIKLTGEAV